MVTKCSHTGIENLTNDQVREAVDTQKLYWCQLTVGGGHRMALLCPGCYHLVLGAVEPLVPPAIPTKD